MLVYSSILYYLSRKSNRPSFQLFADLFCRAVQTCNGQRTNRIEIFNIYISAPESQTVRKFTSIPLLAHITEPQFFILKQ